MKLYLSMSLVFTILFSFMATSSFAQKPEKEVLRAKVVEVMSGSSIRVKALAPENKTVEFICMILGIDAPVFLYNGAIKQPYGGESKKEMEVMVMGQEVEVTMHGHFFHSADGLCSVHKDGRDVGLEMIKKGYAWVMMGSEEDEKKLPLFLKEYIKAQKEARAKKAGLWKDQDPTPPWRFRKTIREKEKELFKR